MAGYSGWWTSLQEFLKNFKAPKAPPSVGPRQTVYHAPTPETPRDPGDIAGVLLEASRRGVLCWMQYNGHKRYIEPYSYRFRGGHQLLYAFCWKDQHIEAFRPDRIQDIELTDIPFKPRWPIEIGHGD